MVSVNDVVQIGPDHDWSGCFLLVTEVKSWGIEGFVQIPMQGKAYIRIKHAQYERIGTAVFVLNS